jgi:polysaccharide export outer membrane protein
MKAQSLTVLLASLICLLAAPNAFAQEQQQQGGQSSSSTGQTAGMSSAAEALGTVSDAAGIRRYQLGPGDVVEMRVYSDATLTGKYRVDEDGNVDVPLIGPVSAKCRTDLELKQDIVAGLKKYLKNPSVSLSVVERNSRPMATVFGAVRAPTRVQMNRRVRLIELLAVAGGATEQASADIQIYHTEPVMCPGPEDLAQMELEKKTEDSLAVPYNIYNLAEVKTGKQEANPYIRPGDIVIVQEAFPIYVTGQVVQPSNLYLRPGMSLMRAIAQVGGVRKEAKTDKVFIYRQKDGELKPDPITVNFDDIKKNKAPDVELQPYDIIEVGEASLWKGKRLWGTISGMLTGAANQAVAYGPVRILN